MTTWTSDVRDRDPAHGSEVTATALPADLVHAIVEAATSRRVEGTWCSAVRCLAAPRRKACGARLHVRRADPGRVEWSCTRCGESGVITGFEGTKLDMSRYLPKKKKLRVWGIDDESRAYLLAAMTFVPSLRAVLARAHPVDTVPGLLIVEATVAELDELYSVVEDLSEAMRGRRPRELLDGLRASLCTAIDGF